MDVTLSAVKGNAYLIAAVPAIGISASLGVRAVYVIAGGTCKLVSTITEIFGNKFLDKMISKGSNALGKSLLNRATDDFLYEVKLGVYLAGMTTTVVAAQVLLEQPEFAFLKTPPTYEEIKAYAELGVEKLGNYTEQVKPIIKEQCYHIVDKARSYIGLGTNLPAG